MSEAKTTTDHAAIRAWAEKRGGRPATAKGTGDAGQPGVLRIDFGPAEPGLEEIPWERFFATFEESGLAFLHQEETKDGSESRFFKLVRR